MNKFNLLDRKHKTHKLIRVNTIHNHTKTCHNNLSRRLLTNESKNDSIFQY